MALPFAGGVLGLLAFYVSLQHCLGADPCSSYKTLQHDKRVLSYQSTPTEAEECDRYLPSSDWYRIDGNSGSDLTSSCPDVGQCGTLFPIWLNGSIPGKAEGVVTRTACKRGLFDEQCCETTISIKLKNCGSYRVAYLNVLQGCPGKYCFENKELCPHGQSSESGFAPCTKSFAHLSSSAVAQVEPFVNSSEATRPHDLRLFFHCNRASDGSNSSYFFDVNWYIDGDLVKTFTNVPYSRYNTDTALKEDASWQLPMMVKCSYRARSYRGEVPSPPVLSDEFFAGIKVAPSVLHVNEGSTGTVYFQSTVPVPCITEYLGQPSELSCEIQFENAVNETHGGCTFTGDSVARVQLSHHCGFNFNGRNWSSVQSMSVIAISDGTTRNPRNPALIRLSTSPSINLFPLWENYKLPEIKVMTGDRNRETMDKFCSSYSDVNIITFDGARYTTDIPGRYLLYKHTEKPIEVVSLMTLTEGGRTAVNCAVSVKAGNDVFMIYTCQNKNIIERLGCERDNNLDVRFKQNYKNTQIVLPTGTKVDIQYNQWRTFYFLNIYLHPSPDDVGKVTGLCGDLDGNRDNESSSLGSQYRLGDFLDSDAFVQAVTGSFSVNHQICLCPPTYREHLVLTNTVTCSWQTGVSCSRMKWNERPCQSRQKRDAHLDEEDWVSGELMQETPRLKRVARSTWTLPAARAKCLKVFEQYASFNKCRELSGVDVDSVLDGCAADVVSLSETGWIPVALEVIKSQCFNILDVDLDLWTPTSPGAASLGEIIFTEAKCPSECNDNGHCVKGVCQCKPDFVEDDCSVNLKLPPAVERLTRNGLCDLGNPNTSCSATHVLGNDFYDSERLTCRLKEFLIDETGLKVNSTSTVHQAVYENFRQILCTFPDTKTFSTPHDGVGVHGYHVEVSNNGVLYSTSLTFVAFDPRCNQCNLKNMVCSRKADSCLIEGKCYTWGEVKPSEPHMKCKPTLNGFKWTQDTVRLVDGQSNLEGRVELLHDGKWGTLCDHYFDDIDATVICRMLGYDDIPGNAKALKNFGGGTDPIWFDDPECKGTEADIADCQRMFKTAMPVWGTNNCQHSEDVGVRCAPRSSIPIIG